MKGVAVDTHGSLFISNEEEIFEFSNASKNKAVAHFESEGGESRPGLALDSQGNLYTGVEQPEEASTLEEELTEENELEDTAAGLLVEGLFEFGVISELKLGPGPTATVQVPEFDPEFSTAVAVNTATGPVNGVDERGDVYITNVAPSAGKAISTVAVFNSHHELLQRIAVPKEGTAGQFADGIAVDSKTGVVFVSVARTDKIDAFVQETEGPPTVAGLTACTLGGGAGCPTDPGAAKLSAEVDPHGTDTTYHFEYGAAACSTEPSPCTSTSEADAGHGFADEPVSEEITGLAAGTYHYRIVAKSAKGEASEERTFTILSAAAGLADNRQWELVSPPQKEGNEPEPIASAGSMLRASEDGHAITYAADGPMGECTEGNRNPEYDQILSTRGPSRWRTCNITTPNDNGTGIAPSKVPEYADFSTNLALALVEPYPSYARGGSVFAEPPLAPPASEHEEQLANEGNEYLENTMYLRANPPLEPQASEAAHYQQAVENGKRRAEETGSQGPEGAGYLSLVNALNAPGGEPFGGGAEAGKNKGLEFTQVATPDLSHGVFLSRRAAPGAYEWGPTGTPKLISEIPTAPATSCGGTGPACTPVGVEEVRIGGRAERTQRNAISNNGTRILMTVGELPQAEHLYVRDTATQETLQLDAPESEAGAGKANAMFQAANTDDSTVFFTDNQRLTTDSQATELAPDLYVAELSGGEAEGEALTMKLVDLTPGGTNGESADVPAFGKLNYGGGVLGASEDGSYVYFAASAALAPGASRGACFNEEGGTCNLYVRHFSEGAWQPTQLIATVSGEDAPDWGVDPNAPVGTGGDLSFTASRVSPNGEYLAFMSNRSITGYDNTDRTSGEPDEEVYLYSFATGNVLCASCNPSGERPAGVLDLQSSEGGVQESAEGVGLVADRTGVWNKHWLAASIPGWTTLNLTKSTYQSRYLSNEGRLFFDSPDTLVPAVAKEVEEGKTSKEKVYEYEPNGLGSCAGGTGCISLISKAGAKHESTFLDASTNGNDVFFLSADTLTQEDIDESFDVYDAHVCEAASPCLPPPAGAAPVCGSVEECRPGGYSSSSYQAPASSAEGPGNPTPKVQTLGETGSKGPGTKPLTVRQQLEKALKACRKESKSKRAACEKRARAKYYPKLLASALEACRKHKGSKRKACETTAHKHYALHAKKATRASASRRGR